MSRGAPSDDPYAVGLGLPLGGWSAPRRPVQQPAEEPPPPSALDQLGSRTQETLRSIDFPSFVSGLITGTFQAIVDSTHQQMREFAELVANLSRTVDEFARHNVTDDQVRSWLAETYPADLEVHTGRHGEATVRPSPTATGTHPEWLARFGLGGQDLTSKLTEGALVERARTELAGERMQQLSTMVLIGLNRIVIDEGDIRAKLQFHAIAKQSTTAGVKSGAAGARRANGTQGGFASMYRPAYEPSTAAVSTFDGNVQRNASLRADLLGEVAVRFSTQTFPIERFASGPAMQLIDRNAKPWNRPQASLSVKRADGSELHTSLPESES